jgi:hypothetical protein
MAFLELDGVALPVTKLREVTDDIGADGRAFSGAWLRGVRAYKRRWRGELKIQNPADYLLIRGLIRAEGDHWPLYTHSFSSKGVAPSSERVIYEVSTAADGDAVQWNTGGDFFSPKKLGSGAASFPRAGSGDSPQNLLAANQRDCEDGTTGFTAIDSATIAQNPTHYKAGTKSISVITSGTVNSVKGGVYVSFTGAADTEYSGSVYVKGGSGSESVEVYLRDETGGVDGSKSTVTLPADTWVRIVAPSLTTDSTGSNEVRLIVAESTADSAITFYVDNLQVEANETATLWNDADADAYGFISIPDTVPASLEGVGFTIAAWLAHDEKAASRTRYAVSMLENTGTTNGVELYETWSGSLYRIQGRLGGSSTTALSASLSSTNQWRHAAITYDPAGGHVAKLYIDGVEQDSETLLAASRPDFSADNFAARIGTRAVGTAGIGSFNGLLSDVVILPYPMSAARVAALYAATSPTRPPKALMTGDVVDPETSIEVFGRIEEAELRGFSDGGTWESAGRIVSFELYEA